MALLYFCPKGLFDFYNWTVLFDEKLNKSQLSPTDFIPIC